MKRHIPVELLEVLENLFHCCYSFRYLDDLSKTGSLASDCSILLYADDILLLSLSVTPLEQLLHVCECELAWLDMSINFSKSCCIRIGPRCNIPAAGINSLSGPNLPCTINEMRYLGVYIVRSRSMKCSLDACKRGLCRAANSIFRKTGRTASEEAVLQLISTQCMPI